MYGDRKTGFWVVVHCPNGQVPPESLKYGSYTLWPLGTPSEAVQQMEYTLSRRGVYRPLSKIGRVIGKSPRQVARYLSGEVEPEPGPGWEDLVRFVMEPDWDRRWGIWVGLTRNHRQQGVAL